MAETEERSLDDFFAKRDKKKRKEKSGRGGGANAAAGAATSGGSVASSGASHAAGGSRQGEGGAGGAPNTNAASTGGSSGAASASSRAAHKEEDDWKEFEQEETIDYSGLRVQSMQISEKDDEEGEKRDEPRDNSEEPGGGADKSSGPWNRSAPTQIPIAEPVESPEPVQSGGVYRPPGARETRTRKVPQGPPEIYSDTQFPSLQSTAKHVDTRKDKEMEKSFEVVKHKNRGRDEVSKTQATKLQLDNQYAVLGNH
ncbi:protein CDV3 homolog isoform X1 [Anolis carolinensis]|uniref:CDV3 homolog n=1 Tax=Anolis carolinensis TaxID=28377 RepID=A0A803TLH8_ANOCA|nr:PREDICTED: protein CDV3 homolog isoform X1 [Anolis carolinensis]|eukprot:XP_008113758.1 PREDICTED: protein CDV3 homolog isoform X1 [Anolis carolinensis]